MTVRMKLYIGLLALGVLLVGGGLWLLLNRAPVIDIPEGEPVIVMDILFSMGGEESQLAIYEDGTVIYHEDKGLRPPPLPGESATRTWKKGVLRQDELNSLIDFFKSVQFDELDEYYKSPGASGEGGVISDLYCTISINSGDYNNTVTAFGYFPPDKISPYPSLPYPLGDIYMELKQIIENRMEEVYSETIKS